VRWRKRHNFYLNALRDVDRHIVTLLDELEDRGLASNTIIISPRTTASSTARTR